MPLRRTLALVALLLLVLPAVGLAAMGCLGGCPMMRAGALRSQGTHACCPQPKAALEPGCCAQAPPAATRTVPPVSPDVAHGLPAPVAVTLAAIAAPALAIAPAAVPSRDVGARHAVLRT
jgi:hypothetical protein